MHENECNERMKQEKKNSKYEKEIIKEKQKTTRVRISRHHPSHSICNAKGQVILYTVRTTHYFVCPVLSHCPLRRIFFSPFFFTAIGLRVFSFEYISGQSICGPMRQCLVLSFPTTFDLFSGLGIFFKQKVARFMLLGPAQPTSVDRMCICFIFLMRQLLYRHHRAIKIHLSFLICGIYRVERRELARCGLWST